MDWMYRLTLEGCRVLEFSQKGNDDALTVQTLPAYLGRFNPKWNVRDIAYRLTRARSKNPIPYTRINGELIFSKEKITQWIKGEVDVSVQKKKRKKHSLLCALSSQGL